MTDERWWRPAFNVREGHVVHVDEYTCWHCGVHKHAEGLKIKATDTYLIQKRQGLPDLEGRYFMVVGGGVPCGCGVGSIILWNDPAAGGDTTWLRLFWNGNSEIGA